MCCFGQQGTALWRRSRPKELSKILLEATECNDKEDLFHTSVRKQRPHLKSPKVKLGN